MRAAMLLVGVAQGGTGGAGGTAGLGGTGGVGSFGGSPVTAARSILIPIRILTASAARMGQMVCVAGTVLAAGTGVEGPTAKAHVTVP